MISKRYRLPLTGTILDWVPFSGDPDDPVRPVGVHEIHLDTDGPFELRLLEINIDAGTALVQLVAEKAFHSKVAIHVSKNVSDICGEHGVTHLMRGKNPRPEIRLVFGEP